MTELDGQVAWVTGAGRGIGRATALDRLRFFKSRPGSLHPLSRIGAEEYRSAGFRNLSWCRQYGDGGATVNRRLPGASIQAAAIF